MQRDILQLVTYVFALSCAGAVSVEQEHGAHQLQRHCQPCQCPSRHPGQLLLIAIALLPILFQCHTHVDFLLQ